MRDIFLLAFILSLPALAVLGHDVYLAYTNIHLEAGERFYLSDLGWLWVNYSPDSYDWMIENTDATIWNGFIDPALKESALLIACGPLALYVSIVLIMKIFGLGSFEGQGLFKPLPKAGKNKAQKKKGDFAFSSSNSAKKQTKYKRK